MVKLTMSYNMRGSGDTLLLQPQFLKAPQKSRRQNSRRLEQVKVENTLKSKRTSKGSQEGGSHFSLNIGTRKNIPMPCQHGISDFWEYQITPQFRLTALPGDFAAAAGPIYHLSVGLRQCSLSFYATSRP